MYNKHVYLFLFKFNKNKFWAFSQMGKKNKLQNIKGLIFYKFMGTGGKRGFSLMPDFSTYALLTIWKNKNSIELFLNENKIFKSYKIQSKQIRVLILNTFQSHGNWGGINPFILNKNDELNSDKKIKLDYNKKIAIITRAKVNWSKLFSFWKTVPDSSKSIANAQGVYFYKGIGEIPFIEQATISLWNNLDDVLKFAYKSKAHSKIVKKSREEKWYKEELFSRFYLKKDYLLQK
tara:strand:+ start:4527 stop:5228 length:702 start_codon:yes stop_codon:yes gene_type:complete